MRLARVEKRVGESSGGIKSSCEAKKAWMDEKN